MLTTEFPTLADYTTVISCAVNEEYASFDRHLKDGDEVAFLPPVSGGEVRDSGLGARDSGLGTRDSGLGLGFGTRPGTQDQGLGLSD